MNNRILLIEDTPEVSSILKKVLQEEGYRVWVAEKSKTGVETAISKPWDLILLVDDGSKLHELQMIRNAQIHVPVILVSEQHTTEDVVSGLGKGASDYMIKPFAVEELLARIRNWIDWSRTDRQADGILSASDLTMNLRTHEVTRDGQHIQLTPTEFKLLSFLMRNKGKVLSRDVVLSEVWGYDFTGNTNIVDVYIRYLRRKMDKGFKTKLIQTRRGIGYRFKEPDHRS